MGVGRDLWSEFETQYNEHDASGMAALYASDAVFTHPSGRYQGHDAIQTYLEGLLEGAAKPFSDQTMKTSLLIQERDTVVAEWRWLGTNTGPLIMPDGTEIAATGRTVALSGVNVITVRDGKVASERDYVDIASMMSQLGLLPGT
jgi:steroid delta-isomerase-like uncharacterized protein